MVKEVGVLGVDRLVGAEQLRDTGDLGGRCVVAGDALGRAGAGDVGDHEEQHVRQHGHDQHLHERDQQPSDKEPQRIDPLTANASRSPSPSWLKASVVKTSASAGSSAVQNCTR